MADTKIAELLRGVDPVCYQSWRHLGTPMMEAVAEARRNNWPVGWALVEIEVKRDKNYRVFIDRISDYIERKIAWFGRPENAGLEERIAELVRQKRTETRMKWMPVITEEGSQ